MRILTWLHACLCHLLPAWPPPGQDPEIVGDTPETVEFVGLSNLIDAVADNIGRAEGVRLLDSSGQSAARWGPLDDVVMGGVSVSGIQLEQAAGEEGRAAWVFRCVRGGAPGVGARRCIPRVAAK